MCIGCTGPVGVRHRSSVVEAAAAVRLAYAMRTHLAREKNFDQSAATGRFIVIITISAVAQANPPGKFSSFLFIIIIVVDFFFSSS